MGFGNFSSYGFLLKFGSENRFEVIDPQRLNRERVRQSGCIMLKFVTQVWLIGEASEVPLFFLHFTVHPSLPL